MCKCSSCFWALDVKKRITSTTTRIRNNKRNPTFDLYGLGKRL